MDEPKTFTFDNQEYLPGNFGDTYTHQPVTLRDGRVTVLTSSLPTLPWKRRLAES